MQMKVPNIPFDDDCAVVQQRIERVYGIKVVTRDIPDPLTGDLDGLEIHIDCASGVGAKPAMWGHFKTGHSRPGTLDFVPSGAVSCKSLF
jgi:hypothetical protein